MLFYIGFILIAAWAVGAAGLYDIGSAVHVMLIGGLTLVLLGFVRARDRALRREGADRPVSN